MSGDCDADRIGRNEAARSLDPRDASAVADDARNFAMLDDIDASLGRPARVAPGDGLVAHGAAARLQESTQRRVAAVVEVDERYERLHGLAPEAFRIHAEDAHLIGAAREQIALRLGMKEGERAALADHGIEIELALEALPE